jgi:hypothetical protein
MTRLNWDVVGGRLYEMGIDRGVLYVGTNPGVAWSGLTSVVERPSIAAPKAFYLDGIKYLEYSAPEEFEATINAFTYPDEFAVCDGNVQGFNGLFFTQQRRVPFGFSYRTLIGNDRSETTFGYKIHIVYNALATPSQRSFNTMNPSIEPMDFSWAITTRAPALTGFKRTAHIIIDSRSASPLTLGIIEDILYGSESESPRLPDLDELIEIFTVSGTLEVTDNGDGTATIDGPDEAIIFPDADTATITWPSVVAINPDLYSITTL